ncbi:uncharacterized [Tachysurus ichikawai]
MLRHTRESCLRCRVQEEPHVLGSDRRRRRTDSRAIDSLKSDFCLMTHHVQGSRCEETDQIGKTCERNGYSDSVRNRNASLSCQKWVTSLMRNQMSSCPSQISSTVSLVAGGHKWCGLFI